MTFIDQLLNLLSAVSRLPLAMLLLISILIISEAVVGFIVSPKRPQKMLFGIDEWRDTDFELPGSSSGESRLGREEGIPKEVCILPFPYTDVLLQGETKQLRLYEDRFIDLFDDCMENHSGVVAMGLLAENGIIQTVPLCEIEAYNRMEGFGIFVTIRVVARAQLLQIVKQEPYIRAVCIELRDQLPPNMELPNIMASNIENFMLLLSSMEHRLSQARQNDEVLIDDEEDAEMERRIAIAKFEDRFYSETDNDDDEEGEEVELDRRGRFKKAYEVAYATDTQGYQVTQATGDRSPQELTAISWAAFCTDLLPEEDATYRIQALDCDNLFDRLKLAAQMLRSKKERIREKMEKAGLKFRGDEDEDFSI
jgi:Lon protease-like protein